MSPRAIVVRDLLLLALGIGGFIVLGLAGALSISGAFSWIWFARAIVFSAVLIGLALSIGLQRALRTTHEQGPLSSWRRVDRTQGCSIVLLGLLIAVGLLICGGVLDWWLEWRE